MVDRTGIEQAYNKLYQALIGEDEGILSMVLADDFVIAWPAKTAGEEALPRDKAALIDAVLAGRLRLFSYMTEGLSMVPAEDDGEAVVFVGRSSVVYALCAGREENRPARSSAGVMIKCGLKRGRLGWQFLDAKVSVY